MHIIHDQKLDALEDLIEAANGKPVLVMHTYHYDLDPIQERFGKYSPEKPDGVRELNTADDMANWSAWKISIAAHTRSLDYTLITNNTRAFERVDGLNIDDWVYR